MALLPIITAPDPRLKITAKPVAKVDAEVRTLMDDMLQTMYAAPGIGLAAPQVGSDKRVIVIDCARDEEPPAPLRMANPEVIWQADETELCQEGCLSLPDQFAEVARPVAIKVRFLDETGATRELRTDGLQAVCIQHEIDHLDGILFVDHISRLKRDMILKRLLKARKQGAAPAARAPAPAL